MQSGRFLEPEQSAQRQTLGFVTATTIYEQQHSAKRHVRNPEQIKHCENRSDPYSSPTGT
jgi:hypothetical protein